MTRLTRRNGVPVYAPLIKAVAPTYFEVQIGKSDHRPKERHYGMRFRPAIRKTRRAVAERIALHMRTDGYAVRLVEKG